MVTLSITFSSAVQPEIKFHGDDAAEMRWRMGDLCTEEGIYFSGSGNCVNCHAPDPNGLALVDEDGHTVSPVVDWQATMMANSAKDPFWRAKVAHEGLVNPDHRESIENLCAACHAPQGFHEAHLTGTVGTDGHYTMSDLLEDELGLDGVGCTGCHSIDDDNLANRSNGDLPINPEKVSWGGFENPWDGLMSGQTGFTPVYGEHMRTSEVCASCHSLYTHTQDLEGEETGQVFFEQATYSEWLNSAFNAENIACQGCHMPLVENGAIAATQPNWLFPQRFGKHHFVGGNVFMLQLMRDHAVQLNLSATSAQFDATILRTQSLLQHETAQLAIRQIDPVSAALRFEVEAKNLAGHKFPSGYPSRVAFLEFTAKSALGDTLFHSGSWTPESGISGRDEGFEPHWEVIDSPDKVQIYEFVFGDVTGSSTQVLERASVLLKDNRLPPRGFFSNHVSYDTVRFGPMAVMDADFNRDLEGQEGSGTDRVIYEVPTGVYQGSVHVDAKLHYLSVPARWVESMFDYSESSDVIASFQTMFEEADRTPVRVAEASMLGWTGFDASTAVWRLAPNPVPAGGWVRIIPPEGDSALEVWLVDVRGRTVREIPAAQALEGFDVSEVAIGPFTVRIRGVSGWSVVRGLRIE